MARQPGKGPATPPAAARKPAKDVISQSVEASAAKVADLGNAVQKSPLVGLPEAKSGRKAPGGRKGPPSPEKMPSAAFEEKSSPLDPAPPGAVENEPAADIPEPAALEASVSAGAIAEAAAPEPAASAMPDPPDEQGAVAPADAAPPVVAEAIAPTAHPAASAEAAAPEPAASAMPEPPDGRGAVPPAGEAPPVVVEAEAPTAEPAASAEASQPAAAPSPEPEPTLIARAPAPAVAACASQSMRASMTMMVDGLAALNRKSIDAFRTNAGMTFDLIRSLTGVKSVAEAILIQTEHARRQFEVMSGQAREFQALARQVTTEAAAPLSKGLGRTIKDG